MNNSMFRLGRSVIGGLFALFVANPASAFEAVYGAPAAQENGARGVAPVRFCPNGGFISAGTRTLGNTTDVYVVRTRVDGSVLWERFYNIGAAGSVDRGNSVVELRNGTGFVVVGSTTAPGNQDALFLRLDCNGVAGVALTYGGAATDSASDVIEAQTGNGAATLPGDLVIAGQTVHPAGTNTDAFLIRVRPSGAGVWNRRYDINNLNESFASLTEARPVGAATTGDIVAVGRFRTAAAPDQGYVLRVNGDNGGPGPSSCGAIYGGPDTDRFTGVFESQLAGTAGQLILGGTSTSAAASNDIYLVRAAPNCSPLLQRRIGAPATARLGDESLADIKQLNAALAIAPTGSIVLTGATGQPGTTAFEASLLSANILSLIPIQGRLYGDLAQRRDQGTSLFQVPAGQPGGMIIAGFSDSDAQSVGDPRDLYLVRTNVNGDTTCNATWTPPHVQVQFPASPVNPIGEPFAGIRQWPIVTGAQNTAFLKCP